MTERIATPIDLKSRGASKGRPFLLIAFLLAVACVSTAAKERSLQLYAFEEPHMGTLFKIKLYAPDENSARLAATAAFDRIEELNRVCSDYLPDSELNRLEASPPGQSVRLSGDLHGVLAQAHSVAHVTKGAFDPTVGHYTNLWRRSLRKGILPTAEQLQAVRAKSGYQHIHLMSIRPGGDSATLAVPGLVLDLGGIAKGFAADEALAVLVEHGLSRAAVAAGGDIRLGAPPPGKNSWSIPVLAPGRDTEEHLALLDLENAAVSSSGDREQFVEIDGRSYSHIVDPRTGLGLTHRIAATVIAPKGILSDSYATALCVLGPEDGIALAENHSQLEALIVTTTPDGQEKRFYTTGFPRQAD